MKTIFKKIYKTTLIIIIILFVFLTGIALFTQTGIFKNWLKKQIISNAGKTLNGSLYLKEIKGNLITNLSISKILFVKGPDTLLNLPVLEIQFQPKELIHKKMSFRAVQLDSLNLKIKQLPDSTWNYEYIIKDNKKKTSPADESNFTWHLALDNLALNNGLLALYPLNDSLRSLCFKNINVLCSLNYENKNLTGLLENLSFQINEPRINLNQFYVKLAIANTVLNISQFDLQSDSSQLSGSVSIDLKKTSINKLQLDCNPLDLSEIKKFVPTLPVYGLLETHITAKTINDSLLFEGSLNKKNETIGVRGSVSNLTTVPSFQIDMDFNRLNLITWLDSVQATSNLTGQLNLQGSGKDLKTVNAQLITRLVRSRVNNLHIQNLTASAKISHQKIRTKINTITNSGKIALNGNLDIDNNLKTNATCNFYNINLENFTPNLTTDISGQLKLSGRMNPKDPNAFLTANLSRSSFNNIPVDTLFTNLNYAGQQLKIDSLYLKTKPGQFTMNGTAGPDSMFALNFNYDVGDLNNLLDSTKLEAMGQISGHIEGKIDSFQTKTYYNLNKVAFENNYFEKITGAVSFNYSNKDKSGTGKTTFYNNTVSGLGIDSVRVDVEYANNCIDNSIRVAVNDTINGHVNSVLCLADQPKLAVHEILLNIGKMQWYGDSYPINFEFNEKDYIVNNFHLRSAEQSIYLDGGFGETGKEQLNLIIKNIDLAKISTFLKPEFAIYGILNVKSILAGSSKKPRLEGTINLKNTILNTFSIENLSADIKYDNNLLNIHSTLSRNENEKIELKCDLPVTFPAQNKELIAKDQPLNLRLYSENIDISFLDLLSNNLTKTTGKLTLDIRVTETLNNPMITGTLAVNNAFISVPQFGSNFNNVEILTRLQDNKIEISNISAKNDKGTININGSIVKTKNRFDWEDIKLYFNANNFPLAKSQNLELIINSNITLSGNIKKPVFDGSVDLLRSKIYLPAFQTLQKPAAGKRPTLLNNIDSSKTIAKTQKTDSELMKNLRGKIKVNIPRNAWIRNDDMNIELSGNIDILKDSPAFELFGTIQTIRGTIDLYGRRFKISEGYIIFEGGNEMIPALNIEANYDFRDAYSVKRQLKLKITGKTSQPAITFYLDNNPIEEKDAVSYIVFGRSSDELSFGEKSQLAQNEGLVSSANLEQLLTSRLTGELTNKLQKKLNLDVIEFKGDSNWRQASIILGKYITNDLFLSYKRDFHLGRSHEMVPEEISLEYEINKYLYLQATKGDDKTTGFDIFWKFEK